MIKIGLLLLVVLYMMRFVRSRRTCPKCQRSVRPNRIQPWYGTVLPFGGKWECPSCGHKWKRDG